MANEEYACSTLCGFSLVGGDDTGGGAKVSLIFKGSFSAVDENIDSLLQGEGAPQVVELTMDLATRVLPKTSENRINSSPISKPMNTQLTNSKPILIEPERS